MFADDFDPNEQEVWFAGTPAEWAVGLERLREQVQQARARHLAECLDLLAEHYGIDPRDAGDQVGWRLAKALARQHDALLPDAFPQQVGWAIFWALAFQHVPALRLAKAPRRGRPPLECAVEIEAVVRILCAYADAMGRGETPKPTAVAKEVAAALGGKASFEKIRQMVREMKKVWPAIRRGEATDFQVRLISQIVPFMEGRPRSEQ